MTQRHHHIVVLIKLRFKFELDIIWPLPYKVGRNASSSSYLTGNDTIFSFCGIIVRVTANTSYLLRRSSRVFLEELDKGGRTGKIEPVGDFLYRQVCCLEKHLRFDKHSLVKPLKDRS